MSYVPKEWVTASPDFWGRKPAPAVTKAPAAKPAKPAKPAAKTGAEEGGEIERRLEIFIGLCSPE